MPINWTSNVGSVNSTLVHSLISIVDLYVDSKILFAKRDIFNPFELTRSKEILESGSYSIAPTSQLIVCCSISRFGFALFWSQKIDNHSLWINWYCLDTVCYFYCLIMLCCISHTINELKLYCTSSQEVSNVGTLTYLTVWITVLLLTCTYPESC